MSPADLEVLLSARKSAQSIGRLLQQKISDEVAYQLAIILLDDLSNYNAPMSDRLAHEMKLGMLEVLIPEAVARDVERIRG